MMKTPPRKKNRLHWLQILTHIGAWIPLAVLVYDYLNNRLTVNPIQAATQRMGDVAITLLILSLACTPIYTLTRYAPVIRVNRPLGLYAYMYAAIHLFIFVGIDYAFSFEFILLDLATKRYILVGLAAFLILTALAVTSFRWWMVRMGKNWKRLHRLVYLVNLLVVFHFAWVIKGDVLRLQGDILRPVLAGALVILLLAARIPPVRRRITGALKILSPRPAPEIPARPASDHQIELRKHGTTGD
jgi:sulfoxide reductase heme-binding subunit YedZ